MRTSLLFLIAAIAFFFTGCANLGQHEQRSIDAAHVAIGGLGANLSTIDSEATAIGKATSDPTVLAHVETIRSVVVASKAELAPLNQQIADAAKLLTAYDTDEATLKQFWSPRQRALFWWIVGIIAGLSVTLIVLYFLTGAGPVISAIAVPLFHTFSGGMIWLAGKISTGLKAKAVVAASKAVPPAPTQTTSVTKSAVVVAETVATSKPISSLPGQMA